MLETIREQKLDNGLTILCLKKHGAPVVAAQVWYQTGSRNETAGIRGISHFVEHLMFRGSEHVASEEHSQRINDVGGHCNAFTAEDVTAYLNSVPSSHLEMVLQLEADRMRSLMLDPAIFETEKKVIVEEYHTYLNNPVTKSFLEFRSAFYQGHPYATSPLGTLEDISAISVDDCRRYVERWYRPENAVITVVGDFSDTDEVCDLVSRHFGDIRKPAVEQAREAAAGSPESFEPRIGQWMKRKIDFDVPILLMGYPAPPSCGADALPLEILQLIFSQGETSRLHRAIVRKRSLAVMTGGINHLLKLSGMSMLFALFTPDVSARRVSQAIGSEISRIQREGISAAEMQKVRNSTLTSRVFEMYAADHICQRLGYAQTVEGNYRLWVERLKALEKLTVDEVVTAARTYWDESRRQTLLLTPKKIKPLVFFAGLLRRLIPQR